MNSELEEYINDNREAFDTENIPIKLWDRIEQQIKGVPSGSLVRGIWFSRFAVAVAAGILLILFVSVFYLGRYHNSVKNDLAVTPVPVVPGVNQSPDETFINEFVSRINLKETELKLAAQSQPALYSRFLKDLNNLDSSFNQLRSAPGANSDNKVLIEAMIQNLELQLELLNRQLDIIKQQKNKSNSYEKSI